MAEDTPVTIGIGAICEGGRYVILASDTRASYGDPDASGIAPNDRIGKQWDFHPFKMAASVAGRLGVAHNVVSQLTVEMEKLIAHQEKGGMIYREHIENAIDNARVHEMKRRYNSAARTNFGMTFSQLLRGKLRHGPIDKYAWQQIATLVFKEPFLAEMIVGGFLGDEPVLLKISGKREIEADSDPPAFVIGSTGAKYAMEHLNKRGQHIFSGLPQTLLHIHEAAEKARLNDKYVGLCPAYLIMSANTDGFGIMLHDAACLTEWAKVYAGRSSTDSLNNEISRLQALQCMAKAAPGRRFTRKPPPEEPRHTKRSVSRK